MNSITITKLFEDGAEVIKVPLTNQDQSATLDKADFDLLIELGVTPLWRLHLGQVYERGRSRISIARLIANASKGEAIRYKDGNPLNLRRDNLVNSIGSGKCSTRSKLNQPKAIFQRKIQINTLEIPPSWKQ